MFGFFKKKPKTMLEDLGICAMDIAKAATSNDPLAGLIGLPAQIGGAIQGARDVYGLVLEENSVLSQYFEALSKNDFTQKEALEKAIVTQINGQTGVEDKGRMLVYLMTGKSL